MRSLRLAHLTTVDMSLELLLGTELDVDVEAGHTVFGISAPGPYVPAIAARGVTHVPIPSLTRAWDPARDMAAARELTTALRGLDLDVLHAHNPKTGVLGRVIGRLLGIPVVVNTCHGLWLRSDDRPLQRAVVLTSEALAAQFSHAELYQNASDRAALRRWINPRRTRVASNGIDLSRFGPDDAARARVRSELGIAGDDVLVGSVGRRVAEKGIHEFAHAARALAGRARFVWIGPSDDDKPDAVGEQDGIQFLGLRDDMPDVYAALDVFVLASHREGFSRSAMEAAASGCGLVLSDIRGCREIGVHDEHLLLVAPRDRVALTSAVARMIRDADLRSHLAKAAEQRAHAAFDQRAVAATSLETYRAVARRRGLRW